MKMKIDKEWFERRAKAEADLEIGAGFSVVNVTDAGLAQMEVLAERSLPEWARSELSRLRSIALDMQTGYIEMTARAEAAETRVAELEARLDRAENAVANSAHALESAVEWMSCVEGNLRGAPAFKRDYAVISGVSRAARAFMEGKAND